MTAGRELDARVNHAVFGAPRARDADAFTMAGYWAVNEERFVHCPPYSTDIAAAWLVLGEMRGLLFSHRNHFKSALKVIVTRRMGMGQQIADDEVLLQVEPVDICLASLEVMEIRG